MGSLVPQSLAAVATVTLIIGIFIQFFTRYSNKAALWLVLIGGFGVAGGIAGGVLDGALGAVQEASASLTASLFGVGFAGLILAIGFIWFLGQAGKRGDGGPSGKAMQIVALANAAILGAFLSGIDPLYSGAEDVVSTAGSALASILG